MIMRILLAALLALATYNPPAVFAQAALGITPCVQSGSVPTSMSVTTVTSNVHFSTCGPTVVVYNTTSQEVFYNVGTASNTGATTAGYSIPGSFYVILNVGSAGLYFAAITASGSSTLRFVQGRAQ